jgi:lysozyme family protein
LGKQTLSAVMDAYSANKIALIERYSDEKDAYYHSLPTFPIYGRGWMNRIDIVENRAKVMA